MELLTRLVRWYKLNYGVGDAMLTAGAELAVCPHCDTKTPVYDSAYNAAGKPTIFTVCLWCDGLIEYSDAVTQPHRPYATAHDLHQESRPK